MPTIDSPRRARPVSAAVGIASASDIPMGDPTSTYRGVSALLGMNAQATSQSASRLASAYGQEADAAGALGRDISRGVNLINSHVQRKYAEAQAARDQRKKLAEDIEVRKLLNQFMVDSEKQDMERRQSYESDPEGYLDDYVPFMQKLADNYSGSNETVTGLFQRQAASYIGSHVDNASRWVNAKQLERLKNDLVESGTLLAANGAKVVAGTEDLNAPDLLGKFNQGLSNILNEARTPAMMNALGKDGSDKWASKWATEYKKIAVNTMLAEAPAAFAIQLSEGKWDYHFSPEDKHMYTQKAIQYAKEQREAEDFVFEASYAKAFNGVAGQLLNGKLDFSEWNEYGQKLQERFILASDPGVREKLKKGLELHAMIEDIALRKFDKNIIEDPIQLAEFKQRALGLKQETRRRTGKKKEVLNAVDHLDELVELQYDVVQARHRGEINKSTFKNLMTRIIQPKLEVIEAIDSEKAGAKKKWFSDEMKPKYFDDSRSGYQHWAYTEAKKITDGIYDNKSRASLLNELVDSFVLNYEKLANKQGFEPNFKQTMNLFGDLKKQVYAKQLGIDPDSKEPQYFYDPGKGKAYVFSDGKLSEYMKG